MDSPLAPLLNDLQIHKNQVKGFSGLESLLVISFDFRLISKFPSGGKEHFGPFANGAVKVLGEMREVMHAAKTMLI